MILGESTQVIAEIELVFNPDKMFLGTRCVHGHEWAGTGKSVRHRNSKRECVICVRKRDRKRSTTQNWKEKAKRSYHKTKDNPEIKARRKKYAESHKEEISAYHRRYDSECRDKSKRRAQSRASYARLAATDPEFLKKRSDYYSEYFAKKRREDPSFRVHESMSAGVRGALTIEINGRKRQKKGRAKWETVVGYTVQELMTHLEGQFKEGMSWDNYGKWHIDHIRPQSSFTFTSMEDSEFQECWRLENLQPLWATENIKKGNRY